MSAITKSVIAAPISAFPCGSDLLDEEDDREPPDSEVLQLAEEEGFTARRVVDEAYPHILGCWELRLEGVDDFVFPTYADDNRIAINCMLDIAPLVDALRRATDLAREAGAMLLALHDSPEDDGGGN